MSKKVSSRFLSVLLSLSVLITAINTGISVLANTQEYSGGSGTELDPYLISSVADFQKLDKDTVAGKTDGKYYKLTADLTIENLAIGQNRSVPVPSLCGSGTNVTDIKPFKGVFDGNNYTVTYTYNECYAYGGLFSGLDGAVVKNLTVKGTADGANVFFGSVAAVMYNSTIDNCVSEVEITNARKTTGGIVAIMQDSTISNTENRGNLTTKVNSEGAPNVSHGDLGKHVAAIFTSVPSSVMDGGESNIGGIVAYASGVVTFNNVLNSGNVSNNVNNSSDGSIVNHTGGIVGKYYSSTAANLVMNSVGNTGNISVGKNVPNTNDRTGGIYGRLEAAKYYLNVVWNAGTVTPSSNGSYPAQTGSIGGSVGGGSAALYSDKINKIYAKLGTVTGFVEKNNTDCLQEFLGNGGKLTSDAQIWVYYSGNAYAYEGKAASYRDMTSDEKFLKDLGSGWQAVENGYPIIKNTLFGGGSGTESKPYLISSVADFEKLDADTVAGKTDGNYYKLTADLTVDNISIGQNRGANDLYVSGTQTLPDAKPFEGTFDGNHHKITYTYNVNYALGGLFTGLKKATVKNLTVKGNAEAPNVIFGSIAAIAQNSVIENCVSEVVITDARQWTGGIVAIMDGTTITDTENRGNITTDINASAIDSAKIQTYLSNAYGIADTYLKYEHVITGGIAAVSVGETVFTNVLNTGNVTSKLNAQSEVGGILGINKNPNSNNKNNLIMTAVGNTGNVTSEISISNTRNSDRIGGIYGRLEAAKYYLNVVWNTGTVNATNDTDKQKGSIGGSVGGGSAAHDSVTNETPHKIYAKIGTVIGYSGTKCQEEFLGNGGAIYGTSWIYYYGDAYESTNGSYRDMTSNAKFFTDLGDGWRKVDYEYPTLAYHYTIGDFNNDGALDILDLVSIKKYTVQANNSSDIVINSCDFDESGDVDSNDLPSVKKLLLGNKLQDVLVSQNTVLRVYSQNVCSHGDGGEAPAADRRSLLQTRIQERNPNIVVLTECDYDWAYSLTSQTYGYALAENKRMGLSEIQILYKADEFELVENTVENTVDDSKRSAYHWAILKSKKTGKQFMVYGYHGDSANADTRATEIAAMNDTVSAKALPTVVAGDFNAEYSAFKSQLSGLTRTAQGSADKPTHLGWDSANNITIDHILYSTDSFDARSYYVLPQKVKDTILSDHCALLSELKLK